MMFEPHPKNVTAALNVLSLTGLNRVVHLMLAGVALAPLVASFLQSLALNDVLLARSRVPGWRVLWHNRPF
jgi:hypothetical protein